MDATSSHRLLVTGGAGFIGSIFIRHILREFPHWHVLCFDALTYAGNLHNLDDVNSHPHFQFTRGDVTDSTKVALAFSNFLPDVVVHFAAETHVDRGIKDPEPFLRTNILGTQILLDAARRNAISRFIHISTDEVYGTVPAPASCTETAPLAPTNNYAASKAAGDMLAQVAWTTWKTPVIILRSTNNYGSHQFPEKLIPLMISRALANQPLPVYGSGLQMRSWIHVRDFCTAIVTVLLYGTSGEIYNVGTDDCLTNLQIIETILHTLDAPINSIQHVADRPGHDQRYALNWQKIAALGWKPRISLADGLRETIQWYCSHPHWLEQPATAHHCHFDTNK